MSHYRVKFSAVSAAPLADDADVRLGAALESLPGADGVGGIKKDARRRRVTAIFWIEVRLGMADAARDGSRLAKEALKVAGMGEAQLVKLAVSLKERTPGEAPAASGAAERAPSA